MKKLNEIEKEKLTAICELYCCKDRVALMEEYDYNKSIKISKYKEITEKLASKSTELTQNDRTLIIIAIVWMLNNIRHSEEVNQYYTKLKQKIKELA